MRSDNECSKLDASISIHKIRCIFCLCALIFFSPSACEKHTVQKTPRPPDLRSCTHIEVLCPEIRELTLATSLFDPDFLSSEEIDSLESLKRFDIYDKKIIRDFISQISLGWSFKGAIEGNVPIGKPYLGLIFYHNKERIEQITMYGLSLIVTDKSHWFSYERKLPNLLLAGPQEIKMLVLRLHCGLKLWALYEEFDLFSKSVKTYPLPIGWCKMLVKNKFVGDTQANEISEEQMRKLFVCPGVADGSSHYAMNPDCRLNSPPDTVLLFEAKGGWNQHDGPELFTFDNHDPKGGCVLLNDGTIKFIRTKEELQKLRWNRNERIIKNN